MCVRESLGKALAVGQHCNTAGVCSMCVRRSVCVDTQPWIDLFDSANVRQKAVNFGVFGGITYDLNILVCCMRPKVNDGRKGSRRFRFPYQRLAYLVIRFC